VKDGSVVTNDSRMWPTCIDKRQESKESSLAGTEFLNEQMLQESRH